MTPEAAAPPPLLRIQNLGKSFGAHRVLDDVSLEVAEGELVSVIGPSGSGKSTLLRCVNRLEEPSSGRIFLGDQEVTAPDAPLNALRRQIGMVFQAFNLYPHLSARDNVALALRKVLRLPKAEAHERAREALRRVGLSDKEFAYPGQLSGGQQQRVGIARALALEPRVMLFDEPTSALDPELVSEVLAVMGEMKARGMTMMVVTHEMAFAREAADRVVFMDHGRIVASGTPGEMFGGHENARLTSFVGSILRR